MRATAGQSVGSKCASTSGCNARSGLSAGGDARERNASLDYMSEEATVCAAPAEALRQGLPAYLTMPGSSASAINHSSAMQTSLPGEGEFPGSPDRLPEESIGPA